MKKSIASIIVGVGLALLLAGCGEPVPQNKLALAVRTLGERSTTNAASSAEIYWARRLPPGIGMRPGVRVFKFPLGLQDYSFTKKASYESPSNEAIETDCVGGHLSFDVNIQLALDDNLLRTNATELENKLLMFINDQQMSAYNGEHDMLARWAGEKLRQYVREPLSQYTLSKQAIDVMRSKKEMNEILLRRMNERFGKYGLVFKSAAVTSPIELPADQKDRMNQIVKQEYANKALLLREKSFMPLQTEMTRIEQMGLTKCQDEKNRGTTESMRIEAEAQQQRRQMFIGLVGESEYVTLEQMLTTVKSLEGGNTRVYVVPKTLAYMNLPGENERRAPEGNPGPPVLPGKKGGNRP